MRRTYLQFLVALVVLLSALPVAAQIVLDSGPIPLGNLSSYNRDAAMLPGGEFVVVWSDFSYIVGQKFSGGSPGATFPVSTYYAFPQYPKVDADGAGNFWVGWEDYSDIKLRGFAASTNPLTSEFVVSGYPFGSKILEGIGARRSAGGFVVLFGDSYTFDGMAEGFDGTGTQSFSPVSGSPYPYGNKLAVDPVGNFLVLWNGDALLEGATFDSTGNPLASLTFQTSMPCCENKFDAAGLTTGNFVVVWADQYNDIKAQLVTTSDPSGPAPGPVTTVASGLTDPSVAVAGNGTYFVVVWHEYYYMGFGQPAVTRGRASMRPGSPVAKTASAGRTISAAGDVTAQAFTNALSPFGGPTVMNPGSPATNSSPNVSMNSSNQFVVTWNNYSYAYAQTAALVPPCPNPIPPTLLAPTSGATVTSPVLFQWSGVPGATGYEVFAGVGVTPSLVGTTSGTSLSVPLSTGSGTWYVVAKFGVSCPTAMSNPETFVVEDPFVCPTPSTPNLIAPEDEAELEAGEIVRFEWSAAPGASSYQVWVKVDGGTPKVIGTAGNTFLNRAVEEGTTEWWVVTSFGPGCGTSTTASRTFTAGGEEPPPPPECGLTEAPLPSIVAEATTGEEYVLRWDGMTGVSKYRVQESSTQDFIGGIIQELTVNELKVAFKHPNLTQPTPFYYRVAGIPSCDETKMGPYSVVLRVVGLPKPQPSSTNPQVVTEFGNDDFVETFLFIPGFGEPGKAASAATFSASSNEPWLTVSPASGTLPPDGTTVSLLANPKDLGLGANTATVTVTRDDGLGKTTAGSSTSSIPVAVSLVTPVTPVPKTAGPPQNALIIPAVANVTGINSKWFSDVKVTNRSNQVINYQLNFSATDQSGVVNGKQTKITIRPGQTVALDDVVRQWYGFGDLADGTNGALEIRPMNFTGKVGPEAAPQLATVASSRTYTRAENSLASFGQFIPAVPFSGFLKAGVQDSLLMMQQVSQTESLRTNFGLVEGAGKDVSVLLTAYDREGAKLGEFPVDLKAGEHKQLNSLLALNGISVQDGRMSVQIVSGEGAVTSYASVVASGTGDPSLVPGIDPSSIVANKFVLPGVADLRIGDANWRSDVRIFNPNAGPETVNVFFYPQGETTPLGPVEIQVQPGQIEVLPGVVESLFGRQDLGGALHIVPLDGENTSLVITGETYDVSELGKYGQFIPAVTEANAIGVGSPGLEVMQVEESAQFRTNLGLAEVTGQSATVQIQLTVPNSLVAPTKQITLDGNEFQQLNGVVREMTGGRDVYNGRLTVRVVGGPGKITAYGSTVDNQTQDATFSAGH